MIDLRDSHVIKFNDMIKLEFRFLDIHATLYNVIWDDQEQITLKWYLSKGVEINIYDDKETELTLPFIISDKALKYEYEVPQPYPYSIGWYRRDHGKTHNSKHRFSATFTRKTVKEVANL